ncbi:GTPase domain-containing protein [Alicyclobacillus sp. SO9]|uniref:GTPase domain-containing protein n=1 Tax=Alicyclobacillus sp. SO9 TaxID=2665646 RepID=UPI0018E78C14|nr:GTPase domain-containing protein [Alicyclobacillus sp. SO9]QQE80974.1 GTPase domain-containing protein [Alicyclobacillus sp. SO9]
MRRSLVIGRTNVGKTLFCIRFAKYLGVRQLQWFVESADGRTEQMRMSMDEAEQVLSDRSPHKTRCLQSIRVEVPRGKVNRELLLTDTTGLSDGVHPDKTVREAMAQTLETMLSAGIVLHLVDASEIGEHLDERKPRISSELPHSAWGALDAQIAAYGQQTPNYFILANKIDLPKASQGYRALVHKFSKQRVIPVSAMQGTGFREVRQHVWRLA